jgi:hypothetical protein
VAHRRQLLPFRTPDRNELTMDMIGIGLLFDGFPNWRANIEDTVLFASFDGTDRDDLRTLSVLTTWLGVHHETIIASRLVRLIGQLGSRRNKAYWAGVAGWLKCDRRFTKLVDFAGPRVDLAEVGTDFHIGRFGEDPRFEGSPFRVAANNLRDRASDVCSPEIVARHNPTYRYRVMMGPGYRADMWAALEHDPSLRPAELARQTYGSFATAWQVKRDWTLVHGDPAEERVG